mgnify:CR=1 FL=1
MTEAASNAYYASLTSRERRNEWQTPDRVFRALADTYGPFTLDAAANRYNARCKRFNSFEKPDRHEWLGWFHNWAIRGTILVPKGRIEFTPPPGVVASRAMHESIIVVFPQDKKSDSKFGVSARLWSPDTLGE